MSKHRAYGGRDDEGGSDPLLPSGREFLYAHQRVARDTFWLVAYLVYLFGSIAGGVYAFVHRNQNFPQLVRPDTLNDPASCPLNYPGRRRSLLDDLQGHHDEGPFQLDQFIKAAAKWLLISGGGSLLVGVLFVALVRISPGAFVLTALAVQVGLLAAGGTLALLQGATVPGVMLLVLTLIMLVTYCLWRPQIILVVKLLGVAGKGLFANWGLVFVAISMQLLAGLLLIPLVLATLSGYMNGGLIYNPARDPTQATCVDTSGKQVYCCSWQTEPWVPWFTGFAGVAMTWTLFLSYEIKVFTVAGAIARWYFTPVSALPGGSRSGSVPAGSNTLTALGHAMGPGLGTCCCGSFMLTLISLLRKALEKARQEAQNNLLASVVIACLSALYSLLEYLTKFATVRAAITGEAFFPASRSVVDLLRRNFMDAFGVWWLPPFILQGCAIVLSGAWAAAIWLMSYRYWSSQPQGQASDALLATLSFLVAWAVIAYFSALLLNVVDAVFVCVAMDRDAAEVTRPEIVEVVCLLPSVHKQVPVEQPGGEYAVGYAQDPASAPLLPQHGRVTRV